LALVQQNLKAFSECWIDGWPTTSLSVILCAGHIMTRGACMPCKTKKPVGAPLELIDQFVTIHAS
jgi:hypothetical protein